MRRIVLAAVAILLLAAAPAAAAKKHARPFKKHTTFLQIGGQTVRSFTVGQTFEFFDGYWHLNPYSLGAREAGLTGLVSGRCWALDGSGYIC
jgi:hypothetical protein